VDAILRVRSLAEEAVSRGGMALAVSLDISNVFNTLPWECIRAALQHHGVPPYFFFLRRGILMDTPPSGGRKGLCRTPTG